jgi:hypothetical protein
MSFHSDRLMAVASATRPGRDFTLWHYDAGTDDIGDDYFRAAAGIVSNGDQIIIGWMQGIIPHTKTYTIWITANFAVRLLEVG